MSRVDKPVLLVLGTRLSGAQTGVGRYLANLLHSWSKDPGAFGRIAVVSQVPLELESGIDNVVIPSRLPAGLWEHVYLPARLPEHSVLFCPSYTVPMGYRGVSAVTVHDAIQAALPGEFPFWYRYRFLPLYRRSARVANLVIAVSESTASDIQRYYGTPAAKIRTILNGVDETFRPVDPAPAKSSLGIGGRPYVLFVGKISKRRNIPGLMEAFAAADDGSRQLVVVGKNQTSSDLLSIAYRLGIGERFRLLPFVSDTDLIGLYSGAALAVYPSKMEGFGFPVLEAMACGAPVMTIDNSSLREISGDVAILAPTVEVQDLRDTLRGAFADPDDLRRRAEAGPAHASRFRWEDAARETIGVLGQLATTGKSSV